MTFSSFFDDLFGYKPIANIDGTPMMGDLDMNGNPFGLTEIHNSATDSFSCEIDSTLVVVDTSNEDTSSSFTIDVDHSSSSNFDDDCFSTSVGSDDIFGSNFSSNDSFSSCFDD